MPSDEERRRSILEAAEAREPDRLRRYAEEAAARKQPGHYLLRVEMAERRDLGHAHFHTGGPIKWW